MPETQLVPFIISTFFKLRAVQKGEKNVLRR
jgi:hypothetical protein